MRFEVAAALVMGVLLPVLETCRRGMGHWLVNFTTMFEDYVGGLLLLGAGAACLTGKRSGPRWLLLGWASVGGMMSMSFCSQLEITIRGTVLEPNQGCVLLFKFLLWGTSMISLVLSFRYARRHGLAALSRVVSLLALAGLGSVAGCGNSAVPDSAALEEREEVSISSDRSVEVALGSGAASLANSTWAVFRTSDDVRLFRVEFGPQGEMVRLFDNAVFAQPWLGSEVIPDGEPHPTAFFGGRYVSGSYLAEEGDDVGVLGILHGLLGSAHLGTARLSLFGRREGDRIDGTMTRTVEVFADTPFEAPGDAEFAAYALREE